MPAVILPVLALAGLMLFADRAQRSDPEPEPEVSSPTPSAETQTSPSPAPQTSANPTSTPSPSEAAPAASPAAVPQPPVPAAGVTGVTTWEGPDEAVATFSSQRCGREVLRFGAQQYTPGLTGVPNPGGISNLGYSSGSRQLWGDRGAPSTLYITTDGGRTFTEWLAVSENC